MNRTEKKDLIGYAYIRNQIVHSGITPSLREIGRVVGYNSPRSVQLMLDRLKKRGLISYAKGIIMLSPRKTLAMGEQTVAVPLVGAEVPLISFPVPSGDTVVIGTDFFTNNGIPCAVGITFAFSTTLTTYTAAVAADQVTHITYA